MLEGGGSSQLQIISDRQNALQQNILQQVLTQSCDYPRELEVC